MVLQKPRNEAEATFLLARGWELKGKPAHAISRYKEVLRLQPKYIPAYLFLGRLLLSQMRYEEAISVYTQAIYYDPTQHEPHKRLVDTFIKQKGLEGIDEAFKYYQLERMDTKEIDIKPSDIICCVVVRNESIRLPYFLSYYRQKGVDKFFIVDNESTDDTLRYLLQQNDVYTWHSKVSFNRANFGSAWFEVLLRKYGLDHWCLIVDADEIFYYPDCEHKSLHKLCEELDQRNKKALSTVLLEMYSNKAIRLTDYKKGQSFLEVCQYFDKKFYQKKEVLAGPYKNQTEYYGGVRQRVFGERRGAYSLSKIPLIKYGLDMIITSGQHYTNIPPDKIALERGCLLHFEFFSSFYGRIEDEVARGSYYKEALDYVEYAKALAQDSTLTLYDKNHSIKLQDSKQLIELGILKTEESKNVLEEIPPALQEKGSRKRHILLYTDCPIPYGAQIIAHGLVSKLIERGNKVTWVQHKASHHLIEDRIQLGIEHLWLEDDNIYVALNQARAFTNISEAESIYNKANPNMIVFNDGSPVSSLAAKQAAIRMGIPYITIVHQVWSDHAKLFSPYLDRLPETYRHAKEVIAVSNENLHLLHQFFNLPTGQGRVIYNGIAAEFFTKRDPEVRDRLRRVFDVPSNAIICLTVARMDPDKGYQFQLSSMQQLKPTAIWPNLFFVWAGTGCLSNRLKSLAAELGVFRQIKFLGERTDIPDLLDAADIFILPSHYEGMPLAIMEAMAKGIPVIATGVSGIPEELGETGRLLPDPKIDPEATIRDLTNTIQSWAVNPELRHSIGQDCKKRADKMFRAERMVEEYLSIVENALKNVNKSH
jgi:glycosyltransferase involved in cell wall biosynthesis